VTVRTALVVGAGIAGSTLAYGLGRAGIDTTVVDHSGGARSGGNPVDVRGLAIPVTQGMGVLDALRSAATRATRLSAVDTRGREIGWIPVQASTDGFEIGRSDLATILHTAAQPYARFRHGDTVTAIRDDGHSGGGVEVSFQHIPAARFDLVIGADGLHSQIRRLAFGPEQQFVTPLGLYIATSMLEDGVTDPHTVVLHNAPGRAVALHPGTGRPGTAFIFRTPSQPTPPDPRQLLATTYAGMGWRVP
jgi:2-polyprenyl-6-methoxyphenol hydroxylase-like FAD-dependent oxidoreductase